MVAHASKLPESPFGGESEISRAPISQSPISLAQRECLSHQLRNAETALCSIVSLLEHPDYRPQIENLIKPLEGVATSLTRIISHLKAGNFCTLTEEECEFVGKFVGCRDASSSLSES